MAESFLFLLLSYALTQPFPKGEGVYLQNLGTLSARINVDTRSRLYYL